MIELHVKLADGKDTTIKIGEFKATVYIYEEIERLAGRPLDKLEKNGKEIPRQKTMIKDVLKNGDTIKEISSTVHPRSKFQHAVNPRSKFQHAVNPKDIKEGLVKREDVLEITVSFNMEKKTLMVYKGTTIDELKTIVNAIPIFKEIVEILKKVDKRDSVGELVYAKDEKAAYLGWEGDISRNARKYDGSQTLESFDIQDGTIFYCQKLPWTQEDLLESAREKEVRAEKSKKMRENTEQWREQMRQQKSYNPFHQLPRQKTPPPPPPSSQKTSPDPHKQTCTELLKDNGIFSQKDFVKWARTHHPDKFLEASIEEQRKITEHFQRVSGCVDSGVYPKKGGRRTRKNKTKKSKTRKHKSTSK